jgi:hypothetical protein
MEPKTCPLFAVDLYIQVKIICTIRKREHEAIHNELLYRGAL